MIKSVIFDMDGLLVDSEPLWQEAMDAVLTRMGIDPNRIDYSKTMGLRTIEVVEYWGQFFDYKGKTNEEVANEIVADVQARVIARSKLLPGVHQTLEFFKQKQMKIGLASSSPMAFIITVLNHFSIQPYFYTAHTGYDHTYGKPHPAVYLACAKSLDTDPINCLVFEDSITGLTAAKAAKMNVVAVPDPKNRKDLRYSLADVTLDSLLDFNEEVFQKITE